MWRRPPGTGRRRRAPRWWRGVPAGLPGNAPVEFRRAAGETGRQCSGNQRVHAHIGRQKPGEGTGHDEQAGFGRRVGNGAAVAVEGRGGGNVDGGGATVLIQQGNGGANAVERASQIGIEGPVPDLVGEVLDLLVRDALGPGGICSPGRPAGPSALRLGASWRALRRRRRRRRGRPSPPVFPRDRLSDRPPCFRGWRG